MSRARDRYGLRFTDETRYFVAHRSRSEHGHVVCAHCTECIGDDQRLSINHRKEWRYQFDDILADAAFRRLPWDEQKQHMMARYNDPAYLEPMHEACHAFVDHGKVFTPEEAIWINSKARNPDLRPATMPPLKPPVERGQFLGMDALKEQIVFTDQARLQIRQLEPYAVRNLRELTRTRMEAAREAGDEETAALLQEQSQWLKHITTRRYDAVAQRKKAQAER